jgi:hypothetical protein
MVIETAPIDLRPAQVSVFNFMQITRTWKSGAFHHNAGHVLQVQAKLGIHESLLFQESSPGFPHQKGTTGHAGGLLDDPVDQDDALALALPTMVRIMDPVVNKK